MSWWDAIKAATRNDWKSIQALGFVGWLRMTWNDFATVRVRLRDGTLTGYAIHAEVVRTDAAGGPIAMQEAERQAEEQRVERLRRLGL